MSDDLQTITKVKLKKPRRYAVVFKNDDYTPMPFVVEVLVHYFNLPLEDATRVMLQIHQKGRAKVGDYTFEVAEHKAALVMDLARQNQHPLQVFPESI